jgi:O-antigen/teichoic acid export membrane protein
MISRLRKSESARHGILVFSGVAVSAVFSYLYYILISRIAGVETYGAVTSLVSALLVLTAPAAVVQLIVARLAADLKTRGDTAAIGKLADAVTLWTSVAAAGVVVASIAERNALAAYFNIASSEPIVITAVAFGFTAVSFAQRGIFQGVQQFGDYSTSMCIEGVVKVIVGVPLAATMGLNGALIGVLIGQMATFAFALYAFRKRLGTARAPLALDRGLIARVISNVGIAQITFTVLMYYDVPLIKHAFSARDAGLYAAAALVGRAVISVLVFIPTLLMPKVTARVASGRSPLPMFAAGLGFCTLVVALTVIAAAVAPATIVTLLAGRAYAAAGPIVLPYLVASGALALANVVIAYKIGLHHYDFVVPALIIAVAEIAVFALWHPTILTAVTVLMIGHLALFGATLFRINAPVRFADQSVKPAAVASR